MDPTQLVCCSRLAPYKASITDYEPHFSAFMAFVMSSEKVAEAKSTTSSADNKGALTNDNAIAASDNKCVDVSYAIQLVKKVDFGLLESRRYFFAHHHKSSDDMASSDTGTFSSREFVEVFAEDLIDGDFYKVDASKIFKCSVPAHRWSYELNLYERED